MILQLLVLKNKAVLIVIDVKDIALTESDRNEAKHVLHVCQLGRAKVPFLNRYDQYTIDLAIKIINKLLEPKAHPIITFSLDEFFTRWG